MKPDNQTEEPTNMGGGDPLILKIVMTILMPVFWLLDLFRKSDDTNK